MAEIREATNKAWVLGDDRFKRRIQKQLEREEWRQVPEAGIENLKSSESMEYEPIDYDCVIDYFYYNANDSFMVRQ